MIEVSSPLMEVVLFVWAAASLVVGIVRPGFAIALFLNGYNYEQFFGGNEAIGNAIAFVPIFYAAIALMRSRSFSFHIADGLFGAFYALYVLAVLRSPEPDHALLNLVKFSVFGVGGYLSMRAFVTDDRRLGRFLLDLTIGAAVSVILFGVVARPDWPGSPFTQIGEGNQVGFSLSINFALSLVLAYVIAPRRWRILERPALDWLVATALLVGVLTVAVLNGKRGGLLSPFVCVLFLLPLVAARTFHGLSKYLVMLAFVVLVLSVPAQLMVLANLLEDVPPDVLPERFKVPVYMAANVFGLYDHGVGYDPSNEFRTTIFRTAIDDILAHPLLGSGVFAFQRHGLGYAHSIFLELWLEGGLILIASFLAFFVYVVVLGIGQALRSGLSQAAFMFLAGMGSSFIHMWTALSLYEGKMLWLGLGGIVAIQLLRRRSQSVRDRGRADRRSRGRLTAALPVAVISSRSTEQKGPIAGVTGQGKVNVRALTRNL